MPIFWLSEKLAFPNPNQAEEDGLLAMGGDLQPERILLAYKNGIFPWYNEDTPMLWWSPDPRFVLFPSKLKVAKSMRSIFNQQKFQISLDTDFRSVIKQCQQLRSEGTWITPEMLDAYCHLHDLGFAHSVEVRKNGELIGGLYGISLGNVFFGESMFSKESNASKAGFIALVRILQAKGFELIDCQQQTEHLASLGAEPIARTAFLQILTKNEAFPTHQGKWTSWIA